VVRLAGAAVRAEAPGLTRALGGISPSDPPVVPLRGPPARRGGPLDAKLSVNYLRTGLSWADSYRPGWQTWFDRQMRALEDFRLTVTYCFTPEHRGVQPHHTSPPRAVQEFAEFRARMTRRYGD